MASESVDAIVTDPPYHLTTGKNGKAGFMGQAWDGGAIAFDPETWREALRVIKPGGHMLAFGGTRTYHRLTCAIEDAGFEVRDEIVYFLSGDRKRDEFLMSLSDEQREIFLEAFGRPSTVYWTFGQGFPKSADVSKHIDKAAGAEREVIGKRQFADGTFARDGAVMGQHGRFNPANGCPVVTSPATDAAKQWDGFGSALKPSHEPIVLARKKLKGTIAANVLKFGAGGLNINECRIASTTPVQSSAGKGSPFGAGAYPLGEGRLYQGAGRWPANVILSDDEEVKAGFPVTVSQGNRNGEITNTAARSWKNSSVQGIARTDYTDSGSAARFFYTAKASKSDRGEGNTHPTVKPLELMKYLCRLITPPGGTILDLFAGSGSTGKAAIIEGFNFIGIEKDEGYCEIARRRIANEKDRIERAAAERLFA